jgi:hypothetical protein
MPVNSIPFLVVYARDHLLQNVQYQHKISTYKRIRTCVFCKRKCLFFPVANLPTGLSFSQPCDSAVKSFVHLTLYFCYCYDFFWDNCTALISRVQFSP